MVIVGIIAVIAIIISGVYLTQIKNVNHVDATIEIENIKFNVTNGTEFKLTVDNSTDSMNGKTYVADNLNETGYNVNIMTGSNSQNFNLIKTQLKNQFSNIPVQDINGTVVYTTTANNGDLVGQTRYVAIIENADLNTVVVLWSNNPNETVKMAKTLKFTNKTINNDTSTNDTQSDTSSYEPVKNEQPRYTEDNRGVYDNEKQEYTTGQAQGLSKSEAKKWEDKIERDGGMV